jgi:ferrochelatase
MSNLNKQTAILLMAYGSPNSLEEVPAYFTDIRGGRPPAEEILKTIMHHYEIVGGKTPLKEITEAQAQGLQAVLEEAMKGKYKVYVGMKHWYPYIRETMQEIIADGIRNIIAIPLAPHYSKISIGGYKKALDEAIDASNEKMNVSFIEDWHTNPLLIECIVAQINEALPFFKNSTMDDIHVFFTAHSLPARIQEWQDPYESYLRETASLLNDKLQLPHWSFSFQSAGSTGEEWLGPDIIEEIKRVNILGFKNMLICPIGFVSDHLEILFDLDIESQAEAKALGVTLLRTASRNTHPLFIRALASLVLDEENIFKITNIN